MANFRIGIAGLGRMGQRHAENFAHRMAETQVSVACVASDAEADYARRVLRLNDAQITCSFEDFLTRDIDAVVITTPSYLHAQQTIQALQAGHHVLVEKPLAFTVQECQAVESVAAQHSQQVAMVGFVRRFDFSYQNAMQSVLRGDIGTPFLVRSQTTDQYDPSGFFVPFAQFSGGIFLDCSVHDIDLARWFLTHSTSTPAAAPKMAQVFASGHNVRHPDLAQYQDVDNAYGTVIFNNHAHALLYASRTMAHGHETSTEIIGTEGKLVIGHDASKDRVVLSDQNGVRHAVLANFYERFEDAFLREARAFIATCRGEIASLLSLNDATEATAIALALRHSLHDYLSH